MSVSKDILLTSSFFLDFLEEDNYFFLDYKTALWI
jgi:hypothetical protein